MGPEGRATVGVCPVAEVPTGLAAGWLAEARSCVAPPLAGEATAELAELVPGCRVALMAMPTTAATTRTTTAALAHGAPSNRCRRARSVRRWRADGRRGRPGGLAPAGVGLSAAAGFALSDRLKGRPDVRTFAFLSDGELEEGQVWEAAMFAGHHRLARLTVLVDANNSQVDGPVDSITTLEPITDKWRAFGWEATDLDGHDVTALVAALATAADAGRPQVLVCRTSTRHGLACLPPDADGHFIKLPPELAAAAAAELTAEMGPA